jgi:hypothetical protein
MGRRFEDIETRIAEVEKTQQLDQARQRRILEAEAKIFGEEEAAGVGSYAALLERMKIPPAELEKFFREQEREVKRRIELATPHLQLSADELEVIQRRERAILQINPCAWVHNSPGWICTFHAANCGWSHTETANASSACSFNLANNEANPRVEADGQGTMGWRSASLDAWLNFDVPARPAPATALIQTYIELHGFYIVRPMTGWASLIADLEVAGYQYGYSWGSVTSHVLSANTGTMGRHDQAHFLQFNMPVGADPFSVRVTLRLRATAKRGGAFAVGDFGTGAGNSFRVVYVNTYSS